MPPALPRTWTGHSSRQARPMPVLSSYPPPQHQYPHRPHRKSWHIIRRTLQAVLVLIILVALLATLIDLAQQFIHSNRSSKISDLSITFGTYVLIIILCVVLIISRTFSNKRAIASIPKAYLPTQPNDVPKAAYELISNEYNRACVITKVAQPKGRQQAGWGRPGTDFENVYFRSAILSTIPTLRSALTPLFPALGPSLSNSSHARAGPLSPLAPLLKLSPSPVPEALVPLAELYEQQLVRAKYARKEPSERDWDETVKIVAVFVGVLSGGAGGGAMGG
ncbi:hypothetical protein JCM1840_004825 [Sporobolomyces johnsonii]